MSTIAQTRARSGSAVVVRPEPPERIVFHSPALVLGEFRCPVSYRSFSSAGRIVNFVFGFPRRAVWIEREDEPRFVADPSLATLYNPGQPYERHPISDEGDESDWLGLSEEIARDIVRHFNPAHADSDRPFWFHRAVVDRQLFLAQRALFRLANAADADRLEVEERGIRIATAAIACAYQLGTVRARAGRRTREIVENAREAIMSTLFEDVGVSEVARRIGVSPFHLCRIFRAAIGTSLHAYRTEMRLRVALGLLATHRGRLSALAMHVGFSSHSHFTAAFRRAFGCTPSRFRESMRGEVRDVNPVHGAIQRR
jgi:AraC-like DNA-binding protein